MKRLIMLVMAGVVTLALGACDTSTTNIKPVAPATTPAPEAQTQADNSNDGVQVAADDSAPAMADPSAAMNVDPTAPAPVSASPDDMEQPQ